MLLFTTVAFCLSVMLLNPARRARLKLSNLNLRSPCKFNEKKSGKRRELASSTTRRSLLMTLNG